MGEGFAPELVTVQPLTRGTGNHGGPTVSSSGGGGGMGGNRSITIEVPVIIDNRIFGRAVKKVALEDFGLQGIMI
jgi:hypothetical protein